MTILTYKAPHRVLSDLLRSLETTSNIRSESILFAAIGMQYTKRLWYQKSPRTRTYDPGNTNSVPDVSIDEHSDDVDDRSSTNSSLLQAPPVYRAYSEPERPERFAQKSLTLRRKSELQRAGTNANSLLIGSSGQSTGQSGSQSSDALGLHLVHDVPDPHGDIIMVHGLGGNAYKTWCWNRDEENFWPAWLHQEEGLENYRVFTFGYNSNFKGPATNLNVTDFAKSLLSQMLISDGNLGEHSTAIGSQPIIFISHSMGGLVTKKAYVLGRNDDTFAPIISKVHGIIFLATPHRGATYAKMLNHILSSAPLGTSPRAYIADLERDSSALQDINEQFATVCGDLALMSFFETLKTSFGLHKVHIVDKSSGILGYPQERSDGLDADHHTICKYKDREDRNYLSVKNTIRLWAKKISPARPSLASTKRRISSASDTLKKVQSITGVRESADDELKVNQKRILDGTCLWLTDTEEFKYWVNETPVIARPNIFHLVGQPATGKTIIATHVIDHLKSLNEQCQYHFFSNGHQNKKTVAYCLRSIATQLAIINEAFRKKLFELHEDTGIIFSSQDQNFNAIWDQIFEGIIFKMDFKRPLCWVFDGIDEADVPSVLINSLFRMKPSSPVRIFLSSRPFKLPGSQMNSPTVITFPLTVRNTAFDIRRYVQSAVRDFLPDDPEIQNDLVDRILLKAEGSFLWVRLALETLRSNWHTLDDIRESLEEVPPGMEPIYERMLALINSQPTRQQNMARTILTWAVCSWRPLSVSELKVALQPEFSGFVKLQETIVQICGHFISIDSDRITFIHATARKFLVDDRPNMRAFISEESGHEQVAIACLSHLSSDSWKRVFKAVESRNEMSNGKPRPNLLVVAEKEYHFLGYPTCYWAYHVSKATLNSTKLLDALSHFLRSYCLSWIEGIALSKNLRYLTRSAQFLKAFAKRQKRLSRASSPLMSEPSTSSNTAREILLWATDFIRIVGKFGHNIIQSPSAIHKLVPPFCPRDSRIGQVFGTNLDKSFSVNGLPSKGWDDCLASVSVGDGKYVLQVLATDAFFITVRSSVRGPIDTYFADTCALARTLHHGEYIRCARLNKTRTVLATAGAEHYQIWNVITGEGLYHKPNDTRALPVAITFGSSDAELVVALDDCTIRCYDFREIAEIWRFDPATVRHDFHDPPKIVNFSPDLSKVAIAWRGKPPVVFDIMSGDSQNSRYWVLDNHPALWAADRIKWKQDSSSVLILCENTNLIEWHVYDEEQTVHESVKAREMTVSRDGHLLLTSDSAGNISVWTFPTLQLIYRLENENEFVRNITLSPDAQRIYRTTDNKCTVLEPDALVRPDDEELEDQASTVGSVYALEPVIIRDDWGQSRVTSLAYGFADTFFCAGRDDGTVRIHDIVDGAKVCTVSKHDSTSSIIALHWSYSNKYIFSGDDAGHLLAKSLKYREKTGFRIFGVFDIRLRFPIHQLFLNKNENLLLISTSNTDEVWDLETKQKLSHKDWGERQGRQWMQHPFDENLLTWIGPTVVRFYDWRTLEETKTIETEPHNPAIGTSYANHGDKILWVALTSNKQYVIYLADCGHPSTRLSSGLHLEFLSTSNFQAQHPGTLPDDCMADLASQIVRLIGTYQDRIVFLDHDYWLCTWRIDAGVNEVKKHFFLPKDWGSSSNLEMAALNNQGTFFCPQRGNVAIVRHGMKF